MDEIRGASRRCDIEETLGEGKNRRRPLDKGELRIGYYRAREGEEGEGAPIAERVRTGYYLA